MSWLQAILIGLMSCTAASTIACLGTTVGNYTLNRPLVASLFVGLILGDVSGCIQIGIPMQVNARLVQALRAVCGGALEGKNP